MSREPFISFADVQKSFRVDQKSKKAVFSRFGMGIERSHLQALMCASTRAAKIRSLPILV